MHTGRRARGQQVKGSASIWQTGNFPNFSTLLHTCFRREGPGAGGEGLGGERQRHLHPHTESTLPSGGEALGRGAKALEEYDSDTSIKMYLEALDLFEEV